MPLEYYPPVTNFLNVIGKHAFFVKVWTTVILKNALHIIMKN